MIESGQADLLLISWLGIDFHNKGERAYRLLGCDLTYHRELPKPGETLQYDIHVDGHAIQGDVRLFFFHYDCHIEGELAITVRHGQAGFFTDEELANSKGVIWAPEEGTYKEKPSLAEPLVRNIKSAFTHEDIVAYCNGQIQACFGPEYYWTETHTHTPNGSNENFNFLGEIPVLDLNGGPANRGYMRVETAIQPDDWYFIGHFKNDPCMPGTLMAEGCFQMMAFYMTALGHTLKRDGWRFEPVTDQTYHLICRGQVIPSSKLLIYELFVDEIVAEPYPTLWAHVLCTSDGCKAFLCERLGLRLVPDWPVSSKPELLVDKSTSLSSVAVRDGFAYDFNSLINCALGRPQLAFGPDFPGVDHLRPPRLPGPPYHFMTRITNVRGAFGELKTGASVEVEFDTSTVNWYFAESGNSTMPYSVLMEVALQPCGWLSTYVGSTFEYDGELLFRNLDGVATQHREITQNDQIISTKVKLTSISKSGPLVIEKFDVHCFSGNEEVFTMDTAFGFFTLEAMANQKGLPVSETEQSLWELPNNTMIDLTNHPSEFFKSSTACLPASKLLMLDRIVSIWPAGGQNGREFLRAEKDVVASDWFFKAHFYQDPVQPGSLGIEAMLQLLKFAMLHKNLHKEMRNPRFEPVWVGEETEWHYRGQVTPEKSLITIDCEIHKIEQLERRVMLTAEARLWIDGMKIYHAPRIGMCLVDDVIR